MPPIPSQPFGGAASVECGGLPPLYAVPACRDVPQFCAIALELSEARASLARDD
jgi:hypothetical protein